MEFVPRGLCVYCGQVRAPDAPAAPCPGCGRDATAVVWEELGEVTRDRETLAWMLGGMILPAAYLVYAATRWALGAPPTLRGALIAAASALTLGWLAWRALRRPYGTWGFWTDDLHLIGSALWRDRTLTWATAHERVGSPVTLPAAVAALTEAGAGALDDATLEATLRGPLALDDDRAAALHDRNPYVPAEALAVAGMIARGSLRAYWQKGWRQTTIVSPSWEASRQLAVEEGDATLARGPFEARVLASVAEVTRAPDPGDPANLAHYRATSAGPRTRICTWDAIIDRWEQEAEPWKPTGVRAAPDDAPATEARRALAAASEADPELVAALLEIQRAR